ncbi:HAD domain-containing protein [Burkholderia gladioli]|uniref:HAD domain-containing protein n=1 Tax=Burkholderia gladioli TaxID=28095 RepID=UPI00056254F1|nr:HAD domain-containing protein [Burkholderia gladioli]
MSYPRKILFLDIDGVLNSHRTVYAADGFPHGFEGADKHRFDWVAVGLIRKICEQEEVSIVLSSSWRIIHTVHTCANGLDLPIFDRTESLAGNRGTEIQEWLDRHPDVEQWAIVDDNSDMLESQRDHFVQTNHEDGLSYADYKALQRILRGELGGSYRNALFWEDQ